MSTVKSTLAKILLQNIVKGLVGVLASQQRVDTISGTRRAVNQDKKVQLNSVKCSIRFTVCCHTIAKPSTCMTYMTLDDLQEGGIDISSQDASSDWCDSCISDSILCKNLPVIKPSKKEHMRRMKCNGRM